MMADLIFMLSGTRTQDSSIWGALIGFTEATVVRDNFPSLTAFSCARAKQFDLFAFRVVYTLTGLYIAKHTSA